ncbi:MAG: Cna B-type domain-containing protein [Eubacteriales bacterium]|nr:Cna B-type domain-containing protein [Eubacteriales bacterium]
MKKVISFALILVMLLNVTVPTVNILAEDLLHTGIQTVGQENAESVTTNNPEGNAQTSNPEENTQTNNPQTNDLQGVGTDSANTAEGTSGPNTGLQNLDTNATGTDDDLTDEEMLNGALRVNGPKEITPYVEIGRVDVWYEEGSGENRRPIYLVKESRQQTDAEGNPMTIVPMGAELSIRYFWGIPPEHMRGSGDKVNPQDYFIIKEPMAESLARLFDEGKSYEIKKTGETNAMGHFTVENGQITVILTREAAEAQFLENGEILLNFKAALRSEVSFHPADKTDQVRVEKRVIETPIGTNPVEYDIFDKGGSQLPATNGMAKPLVWTIHVNRDQLSVMTEGRTMEVRKNIWVEDMLENPAVSVIENSFEFQTTVRAMTREGKVSADAIYYINSSVGPGYPDKYTLIKPIAGESYEDFKTRLKAGVATGQTKPFTVGLYPNDTAQARAARILVYFGSIGGGLGAYYGKLFDRTETAILDNMKKYMVPGGFRPNEYGYTITPEQAELTKAAFGLDGDESTPAKEVPYYTFKFKTMQDKIGPYNNTATMEWDGIPEKIVEKAIGIVTDASGQVGPGAFTRLKVEKKWVGKVGHPVRVQLIKDGTPDASQIVELNEDNGWEHSFLDIPMYRPHSLGQESDKIVYTVREEMHSADRPKYTETQAKDGAGDIVITNTQQNIDLVVTKKWIGTEIGTTDVTFDLYKNGVRYSGYIIPKVPDSPVWKYTVPNLPLMEGGRKVVYSVVETNVPDGYAVTYENASEEEIVIYNLPKKEMKLVKEWDGKQEKSVYVSLYADGALQRFIETPAAGTNPATYEWTGQKEHYTAVLRNGEKALAGGKKLLDHVVIHSDQNWETMVANLPKLNKAGREITYTAQETHISDGNTTTPVTLWTKKYYIEPAQRTNDGFLFKNKELIRISVEKRWEGSHGSGKTAILRLYKGDNADELVAEAGIITMRGNQTQTFRPVKKYDDTKTEIVYTVKEDAMDGFTPEVSGNKVAGFLVFNKYTPSAPPSTPPHSPEPEQTPESKQMPEPKPVPKPKPKPEPTPEKPKTPNEDITDNAVSEGDSNAKPKQPSSVPGKPEDWIVESGIPHGKQELPKTDGIPAEAMHSFGIIISLGGMVLRKKK